DSYNSRIYAYESDVLYSYSIPPFYDKGFRYYFNINYDLSRSFSCWLRWSQTIYENRKSIGSGLDEIVGNKRSDIKLQLRYIF
ncbi:MAG: helix-hairpin-helix domain-containing protein, partial [Bacteroidota bacterium]|nr:helix-hairpin-helix domain-containing protein [Bacteroidota bacterium]